MNIVKTVLKISGFKELNPLQKLAIENGLLSKENMVISAPTASGKTLVAEIAILKTILEDKRKIIYLVPLVALATEKYESFRKKFSSLGIKTAISVGDYDSSDPWLKNYDLIICSNEKLDSLLRHDPEWIDDVGLVIVDEIHLLNDTSRGPTLEVVITRLKNRINARFIALSATISNSNEIAEWLEAKLVKSEWRPVKLYEGVAYDKMIRFPEWREYKLSDGDTDIAIVRNTMEMKKQAIFFVSSRRNAESLSEKLSNVIIKFMSSNEKEKLEEISKDILNVLEKPTRQCERLANVVKKGVAFHHAGLVSKQRKIIEENFRNGTIKIICATPTLAMGVNLPAFRVVIRDSKRYYPGLGSVHIPVLEYKQIVGRAGRPDYHENGESILIAKNEREAEKLIDHYIMGEPEEIYSKLALEPVLRTHVLALIASGDYETETELRNFFSKSFYAYQMGSVFDIIERVESVADDLTDWNFIKNMRATELGKRVSELYIDPFTAHKIVEALKDLKRWNELSFLHIISNTIELSPRLRVYDSEYDEITEKMFEQSEFLPKPIPNEWDIEFENYIQSFKTALMFKDWIDEKTEAEILENYKVSPGELRSRIEIADWLLYACDQIANIIGREELLKEIRKLRLRVKYGVKEDLIELVKLPGIGRIKARRLANVGIKTINQLKRIPESKLSEIIGTKTAKKIKEKLKA